MAVWRCGEVSCWTRFGKKLPVVRQTFFPCSRRWRRSQFKSRRTFVHIKDRLRVVICEPVKVDDDDKIFGRQRIDNTERIFVRWSLAWSSLAYWSIHQLHALLVARAKPIDWTVLENTCQPYYYNLWICCICLLINILYKISCLTVATQIQCINIQLVWCRKTIMAWLSDVWWKIFFTVCLAVSTEYQRVTDGRTDILRRHRLRGN